MIIGLTGRAGSGKTTAQTYVSNVCLVSIIDLDKIGHELLTQSYIIKQLTHSFGQSICLPDGSINRNKLGQHVFSNKSNRLELNRIMHPAIKKNVVDQCSQPQSSPTIIVGALLHEIDLEHLCNCIVVIDTDDKNIELTDPKKYAILNHQRDRNTYRESATYVITNEFNDSFKEDCESLFKKILAGYTSHYD